MKLSETNWNFFVLFINDKMEIEHAVGYESLPNISSLIENFNELKTDEEFKIPNSESLNVDIISKEKYIEFMGDFEINE